ncbi:MAG: efflux RND transporter permease subunit [Gammaproteobacteria bacterium]|nr:efflux RND transporter permease subunit [Gammaproteobacteria bacterium]
MSTSEHEGPIVRLAARFHDNGHLLALVVLTVVIGGVSALVGLPRIEDPRITTRNALIVTTLPGAPALRVETLVTDKIEDRLRELADRLRNVSGTEIVRRFGAPEEELTVTLDPRESAALGLSAADLAQRIAAADARTAAGMLRAPQRDLLVEVAGELDSAARIARVPVARDRQGGLVRLGDIATVARNWREPPATIALADARRSVLVATRPTQDVRLDAWTRAARAVVDEFRRDIGGGVGVDVVFEQNQYTERRLAGLGRNLLLGALVVMCVVLVAMGWRSALVVGTALPLSAAATVFSLGVLGESIHQMSVFGLIVAVGLLIDNAIVMTDELRERLRAGAAPRAAVAGAVAHLGVPLFASTFTTVLGFMPILLLPGNIGDFVRPIALSVILALSVSFVLSMTVIPALAARIGPGGGGRSLWRHGFSSARLGGAYRRGLAWIVGHPRAAIAASLVLPLAGFLAAATLPSQFFPPADRDQFEIQVWLPTDTAVAATARTVVAIDAVIRGHAGVLGTTWVAGASSPPVYYNQLEDQDGSPAYARGVVRVEDAALAQVLIPALQQELDGRLRDARIVVKSFGQGPPVSAPVGFRIYGHDPAILRVLGESVRRVMHEIPAITHTRASMVGGEPRLWLAADEAEAGLAGFSLRDVTGQLQSALEGLPGGSVIEDTEELPVRVRFGDAERSNPDRIAGLSLATGSGWVPAAALGALELRPGIASITRRNGLRVNTVEAWTRQGALPIEIGRAVSARLAATGFELPAGYRMEPAGDSEEQQRALRQLATWLPVLITLMLATVVLSFRSFALAALIGLVAVLSLGHGLLSLWLGGFALGFNPIIGSAGLVGVAINGTIVVLAAIRADPLARVGRRDAVAAATLRSSRHIIATTLTTVAGFVPLIAFSSGDFWPPLAVIIAGGVGLSIILSLVLTPAVYVLLGRHRAAQPAPAPAVVPLSPA